MKHDLLLKLIAEYMVDDEIREVAQYLIFRQNLVHRAIGTIEMGGATVPDVAPEQLLNVLAYENNFINNTFYQSNFAVVKSLIAQDDMILSSRSMYFKQSKQTITSGLIVKDLLANRFGGLSTLVYLGYGIEVGKEFDFKLRELVKLSDEEHAFFASYGL